MLFKNRHDVDEKNGVDERGWLLYRSLHLARPHLASRLILWEFMLEAYPAFGVASLVIERRYPSAASIVFKQLVFKKVL